MALRINHQAVTSWQDWLNKTYGGDWVPTEGFFTTTELTLNQDASVVFNANRGYPLKLFVNNKTGEVKMFDARRFYVA